MCLCTQSCPTLCDTMDCSPPGSSVYRILQARTCIGCHFLLQRIFLTQGSSLHLLHLLALAGRFFTTEPPGKVDNDMIGFKTRRLQMNKNNISSLSWVHASHIIFLNVYWFPSIFTCLIHLEFIFM